MVIVAVVLLLLGPDKLPEVAHKLGSSWRALKRIQERVESEVREVIPDLPSSGDLARIARSPVNLLNQLADRAEAKESDESLAEPAPDVEPVVGDHIPEATLVAPPISPPPSASSPGETLPAADPSLN
jgi:Sec-independent protein translocase protein TatA